MIRESVQSMIGYVPGEQPNDKGITKLNTNENPYPPSPVVAEALAGMNADDLLLYPDPVCRDLKNRIAELHGCDVSQVFVGNGSDEILALCTRAFVENDGSVGYYDPSYSLYPVLADIRDVEKKPLSLNDEFECVVPDDYQCSLFLMTNPNAPTGILMASDRVRAFCERMKGVVVVDEAYVDFARESSMSLALERENVLVMRTFSKSYSLAGIRAGYIVGSSALIDAMLKIKDSYNVNALTQTLALAALSDVKYMEDNVAKVKSTRDRLSARLTELGYTVYESDSNFIWVKPSGRTAKELFEYLKDHRILVRYFSDERTKDYIRITIGTDEDIDKLIKAVI